MNNNSSPQRGNRTGTKGGISWQASFTIGVLIVVALYIVGSVKGATMTQGLTVTPKVMASGLKAIRYPVAHPKRVTCRGIGGAVSGRYSTFRCAAVWRRHRVKRFYTRELAVGGWLCAGKTLAGCTMLKHGFYPAYLAVDQGWQPVAVRGWLEAKTGTVPGSVSCTGSVSPMTCTAGSSTVTYSFSAASGGYVETATEG